MLGSAISCGSTAKFLRAAIWFASLLIALPACAGSILDVNAGDAGTLLGIHAPHGSGHLAASGIDVTQITVGSDILTVLMGRMTFTSGAIAGVLRGERLFGPGGSLSVSGCVDPGGVQSCGPGDFRGTLISADFINAMLIEKNGKFFLEAEVLETVNATLAKLLKLPKTTYKAELELALIRIGRSRWEIEGGSLNAIPEPASILLVALVLAALLTRRSVRKTILFALRYGR